ncbi:MAG: hypothetical protein ABIJ74_03360 [archaeon]
MKKISAKRFDKTLEKVFFVLIIVLVLFGCTQTTVKPEKKPADTNNQGNETVNTGNEVTGNELQKEDSMEDITKDLSDLTKELEDIESGIE